MEEKREKRFASFFEKEKESTKMKIPPLSHTVCSAGFINLEAIWSKDKGMSTDIDSVWKLEHRHG